ncbi:class I SAM-dependent methyltransferase [Kribbella deserti]|uniref:Class I SAM-dependent methyltransferase n=1 Tax=Kribbella deserti TaxID=1926257 RepID=A0ABV6QH63_9ACTN
MTDNTVNPDIDPDLATRRLANQSVHDDDPTGWFERLYAAADEGLAVVPWDRGTAHGLLTEWVDTAQPDGTGRRAIVVGAGTGWDAELVANLGYRTIAFDISPSAVEAARRTHPGSEVEYVTADLLDPPAEWNRAFELVVEIYTVQALPAPLQETATKQISELVGPGGTLVVIAMVRQDGQSVEGPPWPLSKSAMQAFATDGLQLIQLDHLTTTPTPHWRAEYLRTA